MQQPIGCDEYGELNSAGGLVSPLGNTQMSLKDFYDLNNIMKDLSSEPLFNEFFKGDENVYLVLVHRIGV